MNKKSEDWLNSVLGQEETSKFLGMANTLKEEAVNNGTIFKQENGEDEMSEKAQDNLEEKEVEEVTEDSVEEVTEESTEEVVEEIANDTVEDAVADPAIDVVALKEATEENFAQVAEIVSAQEARIAELENLVKDLVEKTEKVEQDIEMEKEYSSIPFASFNSLLQKGSVNTTKENSDDSDEVDVEELMKESPSTPAEPSAVPFALGW